MTVVNKKANEHRRKKSNNKQHLVVNSKSFKETLIS